MGKCGGQESIQEHSRLDRCCAEGQKVPHEVRPSHHSWAQVASRAVLVVIHGAARVQYWSLIASPAVDGFSTSTLVTNGDPYRALRLGPGARLRGGQQGSPGPVGVTVYSQDSDLTCVCDATSIGL